MAQQHTVFLLREQFARYASEQPFLKPGVSVGTRDDDVGTFVLREDGKLTGHSDQSFGCDRRGIDFAPCQPPGDIVNPGLRGSLVGIGFDQFNDNDVPRQVQQRQGVVDGAPRFAGVFPRDDYGLEFQPLGS